MRDGFYLFRSPVSERVRRDFSFLRARSSTVIMFYARVANGGEKIKGEKKEKIEKEKIKGIKKKKKYPPPSSPARVNQ